MHVFQACIAGYTIPGRKNAGTVARNYRVASYNLVDQEDTLAAKDALKATETTEMIEEDEDENQVDSTETPEQKGNGSCQNYFMIELWKKVKRGHYQKF